MEHLNFNYIDEGIYIGTNKCCETHFNEDLLKKEGITSDISLEDDAADSPVGVNSYLWLPTPDEKAPSFENIVIGVGMINTLVGMGRKIYVHCKKGHGRAPTLVAAYFISKGKTPEEAKSLIISKRPVMHLTEEQEKALEDFYETTGKIKIV